MSRCVWEHTMRPIAGPGHWASFQATATQTHARCATHNWDWQLPGPTIITQDCPIGRIEEATEAAIAKIEAKANQYLALGDGAQYPKELP